MLERAPNHIEKLADIQILPIQDGEEMIYSVEPRDYFLSSKEHGVVYRIKRRTPFGEELYDYSMRETVAGEEFIFRAVNSFNYGAGYYSLDFISEKYGYAIMGFTPEEIKKLEVIILSFIQTVYTNDNKVTILKFSGAPSSYSKEEVDEARALLKEKRYDSDAEIDSLRPEAVNRALYHIDITDTKLQGASNNYNNKREDVFAYRLGKLFKKYNLPYRIKEDNGSFSDVFIEKTESH
jgi:hypothetical protein